MITRAARRAVAIAVASALSMAAAGADWQFNPSVEAGYLFDDNYRLAPKGSEIDVQGALLDAQLEMVNVMPAGEFSFTPRVRATYFPNQQDLDSTDYFGTLAWQHRGQRVTSDVRADFQQQDVLNSELPDTQIDSGLGDPVLGEHGGLVKLWKRG